MMLDEPKAFARPPGLTEARQLFRALCDVAFLPRPASVRQPLALYGAGNLGRMACNYFASLGIKISLVVDADASRRRQESFWSGMELCRPDEVPALWRASMLLAVCVVNAPYRPLARSLADAGWTSVVPFYDIAESLRNRHPLSNGWFAEPFDRDTAARIEHVLQAWDDDISRAHHLQFLAWRRLRQEWQFLGAPVSSHDRFFIPEVMQGFGDGETIVDAGAHTGQVTCRFLQDLGEQCAHIWSIEPDSANYLSLQQSIEALGPAQRRRVEILPYLLSSASGTRRFRDGLGYASQCDASGEPRAAMALDELRLRPTIIKLHLEGHELDALHGMRATIARERPVVMATSYHNADGLWALPSWFLEHTERYRLLMRLHGWCGTGAVVYAIPQERDAKLGSAP
jgi:FkbM family methyltransferase